MGWATSQMATNTMKSKFIYCGHCDKEVSRTKYYAHKRLYYNRSRKEWSQTKRLNFADDLQVDPRLDLHHERTIINEEGNKWIPKDV